MASSNEVKNEISLLINSQMTSCLLSSIFPYRSKKKSKSAGSRVDLQVGDKTRDGETIVGEPGNEAVCESAGESTFGTETLLFAPPPDAIDSSSVGFPIPSILDNRFPTAIGTGGVSNGSDTFLARTFTADFVCRSSGDACGFVGGGGGRGVEFWAWRRRRGWATGGGEEVGRVARAGSYGTGGTERLEREYLVAESSDEAVLDLRVHSEDWAVFVVAEFASPPPSC